MVVFCKYTFVYSVYVKHFGLANTKKNYSIHISILYNVLYCVPGQANMPLSVTSVCLTGTV